MTEENKTPEMELFIPPSFPVAPPGPCLSLTVLLHLQPVLVLLLQSGCSLQRYNAPLPPKKKSHNVHVCDYKEHKGLFTVVHRQKHLYLEPCQTAGQLTPLLLVCEGKTSQCGFGSMPENTTSICTDLRLERPSLRSPIMRRHFSSLSRSKAKRPVSSTGLEFAAMSNMHLTAQRF